MIEMLTLLCSLQPCFFSEEHRVMQVPTTIIQIYDRPLYEMEMEYKGVTVIFIQPAHEA